MKIYIFINDIDDYLRGNYRYCFTASADADYGKNYTGEDEPNKDWPFIGEVEIDIAQLDHVAITKQAVEIIDHTKLRTQAEYQKKIDMLDEKRNSLLALPGDSNVTNI